MIKRSGLLQALVEFDDAEQATKAKYGLNGADIYDNACTLKVEFGRVITSFGLTKKYAFLLFRWILSRLLQIMQINGTIHAIRVCLSFLLEIPLPYLYFITVHF